MQFPVQNQTTDLANSLADSMIYRSSGSQMFFKVSVLKHFSHLTGRYLWFWGRFLNKVSGLKTYKFIRKRLQHRFFTEKLAKFSRATLFTEHSGGVGISQELFTHSPDKLQLKSYCYDVRQFYLKKFKDCYA